MVSMARDRCTSPAEENDSTKRMVSHTDRLVAAAAELPVAGVQVHTHTGAPASSTIREHVVAAELPSQPHTAIVTQHMAQDSVLLTTESVTLSKTRTFCQML